MVFGGKAEIHPGQVAGPSRSMYTLIPRGNLGSFDNGNKPEKTHADTDTELRTFLVNGNSANHCSTMTASPGVKKKNQ